MSDHASPNATRSCAYCGTRWYADEAPIHIMGCAVMLIECLRRDIAALGFTEIEGDATSISQFGVRYICLVNGYVKEEGDPAVRSPIVEALERTLEYFKMARGAGYDVIVWRIYPVIEETNERTQLYMRFHTMKTQRVNALTVPIESDPVALVARAIYESSQELDIAEVAAMGISREKYAPISWDAYERKERFCTIARAAIDAMPPEDT